MKNSILVSIFIALSALAAPGGAATLDFEDMVLGTAYTPGNSFVTSGVTVTAEDFTFASGVTFGGGFTQVGNGGLANGSGNELEVNNILLDFDVGNVAGLGFAFGEFGGNLNIRVNGVFQNFENFAQINGMTIGGAFVSVVNGFGNDQGTVNLTGAISNFALGGQELYIDNVRTVGAVPLPAGIVLFGSALLGLTGLRRRQKKSS